MLLTKKAKRREEKHGEGLVDYIDPSMQQKTSFIETVRIIYKVELSKIWIHNEKKDQIPPIIPPSLLEFLPARHLT